MNIDLITIWKVVLTAFVVLLLLNGLNEVSGSITSIPDYVLVMFKFTV